VCTHVLCGLCVVYNIVLHVSILQTEDNQPYTEHSLVHTQMKPYQNTTDGANSDKGQTESL